MADATYFQNDSGAASRYLTVRNDGGSAFTYHSERFNTRATHIQRCPGQPGGNFIAGFFTVKSPANRVRGATASGDPGLPCGSLPRVSSPRGSGLAPLRPSAFSGALAQAFQPAGSRNFPVP